MSTFAHFESGAVLNRSRMSSASKIVDAFVSFHCKEQVRGSLMFRSWVYMQSLVFRVINLVIRVVTGVVE